MTRATLPVEPAVAPDDPAGAVSDEELARRFDPVFEEIGQGAVERERDRKLLHEEVRLLVDSGFTAVRVPVRHGGSGASLRQTFDLLIRLAAADPNLPQALRVHFNAVEDFVLAEEAVGSRWLRAIAAGAVFGVAVTEPGVGSADRYRTTVTAAGDRLRVDGVKYYTTGTLYADHLVLAADRDGARVAAVVDVGQPGVEVRDDWDGFGQRLTGSGTVEFRGAEIDADRLLGPGYGSAGRSYGTAHNQLVLLATLAGIADRARTDTVAWVRERTRTFTHAAADLPKDDPLVQQVVGRLSAAAFAARAVTLAAVDELAVTLDGRTDDDARLDVSELAAGQAQSVVTRLVLDATTELFEVGGASLTSTELAADRHWRNARTVASHNPVVFKQKALGAFELNGDRLPYAWSAGVRGTGNSSPASRPGVPAGNERRVTA